MLQNVLFYGEIYTTGKKNYTAAGSAGTDKSHLCYAIQCSRSIVYNTCSSQLINPLQCLRQNDDKHRLVHLPISCIQECILSVRTMCR